MGIEKAFAMWRPGGFRVCPFLKLALPGLILKEVCPATGSVFTGAGWVSHLCRLSFVWKIIVYSEVYW